MLPFCHGVSRMPRSFSYGIYATMPQAISSWATGPLLEQRNKEDEMRKLLLASVATLGSGGLVGTAMAQAPAVGPGRAPSQGQTAWTLGAPTAYVNNNNNLQAAMLPGGN